MYEDNTATYVRDRSAAGSCAHYHATGRHDKELCPLPEGYCDEISRLVSTIKGEACSRGSS